MKKSALALIGLMSVGSLAPTVASATDDWKFAVTPYLWAAGVNGTATVRSHEADLERASTRSSTISPSRS